MKKSALLLGCLIAIAAICLAQDATAKHPKGAGKKAKAHNTESNTESNTEVTNNVPETFSTLWLALPVVSMFGAARLINSKAKHG